jgi:hypothetical protein
MSILRTIKTTLPLRFHGKSRDAFILRITYMLVQFANYLQFLPLQKFVRIECAAIRRYEIRFSAEAGLFTPIQIGLLLGVKRPKHGDHNLHPSSAWSSICRAIFLVPSVPAWHVMGQPLNCKVVTDISLTGSPYILRKHISTNWQQHAHGQTTDQNVPQFLIRGRKLS